MQAHPLSIPAASIPLQSPAPSPTAPPVSPSHHPRGLRRASNSDANCPRPSPPIPRSTAPAAGIAQTSGLAHDAGNLLGALGLYCDLLRVPGVLRPEHRHYATELDLISSRSSDLIRRLLTYALNQPPAPAHSSSVSSAQRDAHTALTPTHPEPLPNPFSLQPSAVRRVSVQTPQNPTLNHASALRNLTPVLQRIASGTANVFVHAPATLPLLDPPVEAMERIAVNLVRNAVEAIRRQHGQGDRAAARPPAEIRVALGVFAARLQLIVEDNGPGIPSPLADLFMRPGDLPSNALRGLGHRIVHDLVTSSGGQISVRTHPGHGSVFCMTWPVDAHQAAPASLQRAPLNLPSTTLGPASAPAEQKGLASC
jgi:signal transduction histidine kinase